MKQKAATAKAKAKAKAGPAAPAGSGEAPLDQASEATRGEISAFLSGVKVTTGDEEVNAARALVLKRYKELPRFSAEKRRLIEQWRADKTCKWVSSLEEVRFASEAVETSTMSGYGTKCGPEQQKNNKKNVCLLVSQCMTLSFFGLRFDVARLLNLDQKTEEGKAVLEAVLSELAHDDKWGDSPIEKGYAKAGLARYHIEHELLSQYTKKEGKTESVNTKGDRVAKDAPTMLADTSCPVKLEFPKWHELQSLAVVLRSAEKKTGMALGMLKRDKATAGARLGEAGGPLTS